DAFYTKSEATITRGDFIRLQDIRIGYILPSGQCRKLGIKQANFYLYANNLGILWRANPYGIDPDAVFYGGLPSPRSWSVGMQVGL
ncbi:MAG: hypothetical protein JST68_12550, partial [Bacteroidetes bacterium]|nr:hypothetical protein [Bacteroidota bacterium]